MPRSPPRSRGSAPPSRASRSTTRTRSARAFRACSTASCRIFNLGTNSGASCDPALRERVVALLAASGAPFVADGRFKGGWITRRYGRPEEGVHALQMELACRAYMAEPERINATNWPTPLDESRAAATRATLKRVLEAALEWVQTMRARFPSPRPSPASGRRRGGGVSPPDEGAPKVTTALSVYVKKGSAMTVSSRLDNMRVVRAPRGSERTAKSWLTEAPLRMLMNNLDPDVAERPGELVVYGGIGRAARDWQAFDRIVETLRRLEADETLLVQSGKPVGVFKTHADAPRVLIANSNLVPRWATWDHFHELDRKGLMMYGQMTAGSWIYIGGQGIVQGTYETFVEMGRRHYGGDLSGKWILTGGLGGMGAAQPLAATMAGASMLAVECRPSAIEFRLRTGYLDVAAKSLDEALE